MDYLPRVVDAELSDALSRTGAVLIEGPKACGKTETAGRFAATTLRLDTDLTVPVAMQTDPNLLLAGKNPRLLDEWQLYPQLWSYVRRTVDDRKLPGQFILTGSATPNDDVRRHSGAGRFARIRMRPLSLWESGVSTGEVSLAGIFAGTDITPAPSPIGVPEIAELVARGGWPASHDKTSRAAQRDAIDYLSIVAESDVATVSGIRRDPERVMRVLRSLARNTASEASVTTIAKDAGGSEQSLTRDTVMAYLDALTRLMIVEDQPAWSPALRSSATLRKAPKRHLADPSLAAAALRADPAALTADLATLGFLFESLAVRDLRIYAQPLDGTVSHYRDSNGREVDAIVHLADGRWIAIEVKLGMGAADAAADSLHRFVQTVDVNREGSPAALVVITGTGMAHQRPDGVTVVPLATLRP